jgi:hypothetical protein|tara:strand:+ start:207 stop:629 length:423 start_codon:yes stop_codon:yes gene_type:complete
MKQSIRELIPPHILRLVEDREYKLKQLSPGAYDVLGSDVLGIPMSAIVDVKIIKAPKPIFKCFLDNGQTFNIIDNGEYMQADINRILFDLDREDDTNGAKYELEKLMQKGSLKQDDDVESSDDFTDEEPPAEEPTEEPEV